MVERLGELPAQLHKKIDDVYHKVAGKGEPLSEEDEDTLFQ